jgi:hypothetical protein
MLKLVLCFSHDSVPFKIQKLKLSTLQFNSTPDHLENLLVPDHESQDLDVVLVRRTINLGKPQGVGKLERGRNGEGMGGGRSVYEQPAAKVDGNAPRKRRDSK